jgi:hypothetical protein
MILATGMLVFLLAILVGLTFLVAAFTGRKVGGLLGLVV